MRPALRRGISFHTNFIFRHGMNDAVTILMGRTLNFLILLLLVLWVAGMLFAAVLGVMVHLLLVLALVAVVFRINHWWKERKKLRSERGMMRT